MEIRKTFWAVLVVLGGSFIGYFLSGSDKAGIFLRLIYLCLLLIFFSWLWSILSVRGFNLRRFGRGLRQQLGQVFEERFEVTNRFFFVRPWLDIRDRSPLPGSGGSRVLSWIGKFELRNYSAYTLLTERGQFILGPTILYSGDPFGIFVARKVIPGDRSLIVLPYIIDLQSFPFPPGLLPGGRAKRQRTIDITPHAAGVREYAPGDTLNRIHWPTTARKDRLMVKEFEQDPQADVWIFLDSQRDIYPVRSRQLDIPKVDQFWLWKRQRIFTLPPDAYEYAISITASVARYFIRGGQSLGFVSVGQQMIVQSAERGERQLGKILETLAFLKPDGRLSLPAVIESQMTHLPRGSTVILITASPHHHVIAALDALLYRHMRPVVVLINPATFGKAYGVQRLYENILVRKIPVAVVDEGTNLKAVLENGFNRWKMRN